VITSNHRDFRYGGLANLRKHPGIVVLDTGAWTNTEDLLVGVDLMFRIFRSLRIGAKPPQRATLEERRLVVSAEMSHIESTDGYRLDVYPANSRGWYPIPRRRSETQ